MEAPASLATSGVAVAETTTVWGVVASFSATVSGALRCGELDGLRSESGGEDFGLVSGVSEAGEGDETVAGGGEDAHTGVAGRAEQRDLHPSDAVARRALHDEREIGGEQRDGCQKNENGKDEAFQLSSLRERGWMKVRAGLLACELRSVDRG